VEDVAVNQVIIATLLRDAGAQVEIANNGALGVQKVMQDMDNGLVFDVILMDMRMPVMDGYEATAYLRKHHYHRPIIAVTAHALTGDREKTLKVGCDDYMAKPIDRHTLIEMVKRYVGLA
jgi:CheY-like chemotaxis protein